MMESVVPVIVVTIAVVAFVAIFVASHLVFSGKTAQKVAKLEDELTYVKDDVDALRERMALMWGWVGKPTPTPIEKSADVVRKMRMDRWRHLEKEEKRETEDAVQERSVSQETPSHGDNFPEMRPDWRLVVGEE